jgi:iron complex outermembrane receptor protein
VTNESGRYQLDNLPAGRYVVEATLNGFAPQAVEIAIDGATTHDVVLAVSSFSDTVTVTATKTGAADIHSTPIAITVLPGRTIEQLGIKAVEGLAGFVPTLTVSHSPGGRVLLTIRGVGTNTGVTGADPSSTTYLDGVYLARPAMASMDLLDVERVEVLRGPQGTLYGRNSVGGAVHILTRQPTNTFETSVRVTAGNYQRLRAEGAVRGPLIRNRVMGSFAFLRGSRDGVVKDLDHPSHPLGSEDTWAGRGQLRVVFGSRSDLLVSGDYARFDGVPLPYAKPIRAKPGFSFDSPPASGKSARATSRPPRASNRVSRQSSQSN